MARNEGPSAHRVPALSPRAATASGRLFTIREQDEGRGGGGRPNRRWQHVPSSLKVAHDYRSPPSGKDTIRRGECGGRGDRDDGRGDSGSGGNRNLVGWGSGRVRGRDGGNSGGSGHGSDGKSGGGSGGSISGGGSGDGSCDIDGGGIGDSGSGGISHCRGGRDADVGGSVGHEPNQNGIAGVPVAKIVVEKRLRFEPKVNHSHGKQSHSKGVRKQRREAHGPRAVSVVLSKVSPGGSPTCKYAGGAVESARASSENGACLFVAGYVTSISARTTKCQERPSRAKPSRHIAASTPGRTRLEDRSSPESRANSTPPPAMANKAGTDNGGAKTDERVRLAKERRQELEKMQASRGELFQEKERKARELYERFMAERRRRLAEQRQREEERRVAVDEKRKQKLAEDKARYEASISRAQEKGPPRRDPRNRWSWGGAIPSNHTASPRKHLDNPDRRSVSTVNLSRHPPDSVVSKRLSMSSATLLNSPDRPGSSGKRKKTNGRRSQLTPMEMSIVSRLLTPTHSSLARSRSVATLSGEGHCPAFASPALTPTHSKQQHRHRSRSQERRFKPFSTPSPLVERLKKEKRISSPGAGLSASPILRPPRRSEPPPRSSPQTGGTTTPVTSGKTSGPLRANHPSPAATAAFVSSKPPSGPQTPRPRVDRKDVKEAKEAKEVKEGKEKKETKDRKETKAEKERVNSATAKDEKRPAIAKKPKLSSPPAAGLKVATPNVAAPVSPLPPPPPSSPQTAGGYREKAAVTPAPATERRGADGAPAEVVEAPAAVAAAPAPVPVVEEKEEEKPGAERVRGEMMRMPTIVVEEAPPVVDSDESEEPTATGWFDETAAAGTNPPTVSTQEAPAGVKRQGDQSPVDGKPSPKEQSADDGAGRESVAKSAETTGPAETARPAPAAAAEAAAAVAATAPATAVTKTPKKSGAAEGDAARPSAATEEVATRTPGGGKGRSDEAKASSSGGGGGGGGKGLAGSTNAEDATRALAEKRKLAREQREKEEQERIAHAEAEKRMKEEIARRKAEERARREEEARRLEEERRVQEEEERRRAEEDRERREIEERERQVEIQKQREEAEVRAREEAEKQRVERARQAHKEEQERLERKKRLEQIMKRTRKSEPNKEKEGKDLEDAPDQQSNGDTGDSPGLLSLNGQTHAREAPTGNGSAAVGSLTTEGSNGRDFEELIDLAMEPRSMKAAVTTESGDAPSDAVGSATTTAPPPNPPLIAFEENGDSLA